jgi:YfiH family protein
MPALRRAERDGLTFFHDPGLEVEAGIVVAFSARLGGVSDAPYASLDLAAHTGDRPSAVDENRGRLLRALDLDPDRLITAEQVHGDVVREVDEEDVGSGARTEGGAAPIAGADALLTRKPLVPVLMMYADCVPVIIVATGPRRAVCVVHAGWRGALAGLAGRAAARVSSASGARPTDLRAYIGPHICRSHYDVSDDLASAFRARFAKSSPSVSIPTAPPKVDLEAAVRASLEESGLQPERVVSLGMCTVEEPALFYSYRAEGLTGRHGALAAFRA